MFQSKKARLLGTNEKGKKRNRNFSKTGAEGFFAAHFVLRSKGARCTGLPTGDNFA